MTGLEQAVQAANDTIRDKTIEGETLQRKLMMLKKDHADICDDKSSQVAETRQRLEDATEENNHQKTLLHELQSHLDKYVLQVYEKYHLLLRRIKQA